MFKKKSTNKNQVQSFKVKHNNGIVLASAGMPIITYDGRYLQVNGVRRVIEVAKMQPKMWNNIKSLKEFATTAPGQGHDLDDQLYVLIMPEWAFNKFKLFKPMSGKEIDRAVAYMVAKYIFDKSFVEGDMTFVSASMFISDIVAKMDDECAEEAYCAIVRILQMFSDNDGYIGNADVEMAARFIACITENCNTNAVKKAILKAMKTSGKDMNKLWKSDKKSSKKKKKEGSSMNLDSFFSDNDEDDSDMMDDDPVEESPKDETIEEKPSTEEEEAPAPIHDLGDDVEDTEFEDEEAPDKELIEEAKIIPEEDEDPIPVNKPE